MEVKEVRRRDIWHADLSHEVGSVQKGTRPVVVISNDFCNRHSPVITVVPITAQLDKANLPTHVLLDHTRYGLDRPSIVLGEQPISIDKQILLEKHRGKIGIEDMARIDHAVKIQLSFL